MEQSISAQRNPRRNFIKSVTYGALAISIPAPVASMLNGKTRISIITDLHQDIMHDGELRLRSFLMDVQKNKPHAILQMGDFATPKNRNKQVVELFNNAHKINMHVLGNHDTDGGFSKEACLSFLGMTSPYYTRLINGIVFIILDGNEKGSPDYKGGYPSFIGKTQVKWLKETLDSINKPVVIVSHQPLAGPMAIDNAREIQELLSIRKSKILLAINGHTHIDASFKIDGVNYVHLNSASYFWAGEKYKHNSYSNIVHEQFPWIAYTFPYRDALFACLTIDPKRKQILIKGQRSAWQGVAPADMDYKITESALEPNHIVPYISSKDINLG